MLSANSKFALKYFLLAFVIFGLSEWLFYKYYISWFIIHILLLVEFVVIAVGLKIFHGDEQDFQISLRATFLGTIFALGLLINLTSPAHIKIFGNYMSVMAIFHFGEYFVMSIIKPAEVSADSFVLNHSPQYVVAALTSWLEFFIESYLFPGMKQIYWLSNIGLIICLCGDALRKIAMLTAGSNFHHLVQCEKSADHQLVTSGVYAWFRHPSYVGWFYWALGTQLLLLNPLCVPAYVLTSWFFFKSRVYIEEITLLNFFGQNYCDYQTKVGTGLPFIDGYRIR